MANETWKITSTWSTTSLSHSSCQKIQITLYYVFTHSVACSLPPLVFPHISCSFCKCYLVFFSLILCTPISLSQCLSLGGDPSVPPICILQPQLQLLLPDLQFVVPLVLSWEHRNDVHGTLQSMPLCNPLHPLLNNSTSTPTMCHCHFSSKFILFTGVITKLINQKYILLCISPKFRCALAQDFSQSLFFSDFSPKGFQNSPTTFSPTAVDAQGWWVHGRVNFQLQKEKKSETLQEDAQLQYLINTWSISAQFP